jgi:hypothetical protein
MYLTDFREYSLKDVIEQLEPDLFRKVTGLTLKDFSLLVSLGVFNSELMNDAVYKFKRYEDSSLEYTGINTHTGTLIGGWDTVIDTSKTVLEEEPEYKAVAEPTPELITETLWENIKPGDTVYHKSLGEGTVMSVDDKYLFVKFPLRESKFIYPDVFENGYLSMTNLSQ